MIRLRARQKEILTYPGGKMGIAAVPGSGKTWTLSLLAADIIAAGGLAEDQEVLVVTLVNSAVDNFYQRVGGFVETRGLIPKIGYRVRTLHGLAHDIVRIRPGLVGLDTNFQIIDEREADAIRSEVANSWLRANPEFFDNFLKPDLDDNRKAQIYREQVPALIQDVALSYIRTAKDMRLTPEAIRHRLDTSPGPLPLVELGWAIYVDYQRALHYRGAVDFDDLVKLALTALESDPEYLARLQYRWPYILEDEAQDSSLLQEKILALLVGEDGNWVRVGDPNQAIYETFTTANPKYLRDFIQRPDVMRRELPNSGRSTQTIIDLANHLVTWSSSEHPVVEVRDALQAPPLIEPTTRDDPQPNPKDDPQRVVIHKKGLTPLEEVHRVVESLERWLPANQDKTVAILVPRNIRGEEVANELNRRNIEYVDSLLRTSSTTRFSAGALGNILRYLSDPGSAKGLARVYEVWRRDLRHDEQGRQQVDQMVSQLRKITRLEDYLWPGPRMDWLEELQRLGESEDRLAELAEFRAMVQRWQAAVLLPVDQLVLTLAQELFTNPDELAVAHKLALLLKHASKSNPSWRLSELTEELRVIARNERRFLGFSQDDSGFDPDRYKGKVVLATIHKAKGLEWDRVYLMSVNNYDFPSGREYDRFISEKWYLRNQLNLEAETKAQLIAAFSIDEYEWYLEGSATAQARLDYVRERLRLLYVGITRAKRELVITWNTGRDGKVQPAVALVALQNFLDGRSSRSASG
jgi:DNA helicase-2/ATP-dependent DNA helicase PcrA